MRTLISKFRFPALLGRLIHDRRGVSAVAFAITLAVLAPMSLGIFDVYQANQQHMKLQDALDAAALYAARSPVTTSADANTVGTKALSANLQLIPGAQLSGSNFALVTTAGITKVVASASVALPAYSPMDQNRTVSVNSEVTRDGNNLEVALVLDNTGSMSGSPMTSLQSAANQLIDLVVSDTQTPFYSKIAIVPYSNAVNAGSYLATVRGATLSSTDSNCKSGANKLGCPSYTFTNMSSNNKTFNVSNCVSERTGSNAFTDAAPTAAADKVGWVYPTTSTSSPNPCISASVQALSSDKTALHATINGLTAGGSTAGHIGLQWGWYMVSPNWNTVFTGNSAPAAYGTDKLIKAVVLMTDGAFNTAYCKGVISGIDSATDGTSGATTDHIKCASGNGSAFTQAQALCNNMKGLPHPIIIYTVGFNVGSDPQAQAILSQCATDAAHVYFPSSGASLQVAFQSIANDLNRLRISK